MLTPATEPRCGFARHFQLYPTSIAVKRFESSIAVDVDPTARIVGRKAIPQPTFAKDACAQRVIMPRILTTLNQLFQTSVVKANHKLVWFFTAILVHVVLVG